MSAHGGSNDDANHCALWTAKTSPPLVALGHVDPSLAELTAKLYRC